MATHSCLEMDRGAQPATVQGGAKSRTRLGTPGAHLKVHRLVPSGAPAGGAPGPLLASSRGGLRGVPRVPPVSSRLREAPSVGLFCISASPVAFYSLVRTPIIVFRSHLNSRMISP